MRVARNSIEHLSEADFDETDIVASPRIDAKGKPIGAWDIEKLPEGRLLLGLGRNPLSMVFDAVSLRAIVDFAYQHAHRDAAALLDASTFLLPQADP